MLEASTGMSGLFFVRLLRRMMVRSCRGAEEQGWWINGKRMLAFDQAALLLPMGSELPVVGSTPFDYAQGPSASIIPKHLPVKAQCFEGEGFVGFGLV